MKKNIIIQNTITACETETIVANAYTDKYNAKQDLIEYFNSNGVTIANGVIADAAGKAFVKAFQEEAAEAYFATGNITLETAKKRVRDFVTNYCGYRLRAPQANRPAKGENAGTRVRVKFNADKTIVVIDGVTYAKVA